MQSFKKLFPKDDWADKNYRLNSKFKERKSCDRHLKEKLRNDRKNRRKRNSNVSITSIPHNVLYAEMMEELKERQKSMINQRNRSSTYNALKKNESWEKQNSYFTDDDMTTLRICLKFLVNLDSPQALKNRDFQAI